MQRVLACFLGLFIVIISATDPIWCVDGCGRAGLTMTTTTSSSSSGVGADCPFCSGIVNSAAVPCGTEIIPMALVRALHMSLPPLVFQTPVDRPPRAIA